jgi:hypothetical protein
MRSNQRVFRKFSVRSAPFLISPRSLDALARYLLTRESRRLQGTGLLRRHIFLPASARVIDGGPA